MLRGIQPLWWSLCVFASPGDTTGEHLEGSAKRWKDRQRLPRSPALSLVHIIERGRPRSKWAASKCVSIEELANLANMSFTPFHRQFKAVTGMSPSQDQKTPRLQEARRSRRCSMPVLQRYIALTSTLQGLIVGS
jgi:hypothetical protein